MALAHSFYAEQPAVRGDLDEARRRRLVRARLLRRVARRPVRGRQPGRTRWAKLALLDGDLAAAERHYRAAAEGFAQLDRPVMMLDVASAWSPTSTSGPATTPPPITTLEAAIATNDARCSAGSPARCYARLGWALLHDGRCAPRRGDRTERGARRRPAACATRTVMFLALTGMAVAAPAPQRDDAAAAAATEALELYRAGESSPVPEPHRPRGRPPAAAAACCVVLGVIAAERDEPDRAASCSGRPNACGRCGRRGAGVPARRRRRARERRWRRSARRVRGRFERGHGRLTAVPPTS